VAVGPAGLVVEWDAERSDVMSAGSVNFDAARIEWGEIDPSFIITYRIGLEDAPAIYCTFRDKRDACIKVVMKPGVATPHHTDPPSSRQL
jgi:threonine dehydrogenase-like Zn-dependent dehydrogenase